MLGMMWLRGILARRRGRTVAVAAGVALAVALLASIGAFLGASKATMTKRAIADVAVDWQVQLSPTADRAATLDAIRAHPGVATALPVGFADTTGLSATTGGSTQTTGPGVVLGLPDGYQTTFPGELRALVGDTTGVLLAQQTAANLHAAPGDTVTIGREGLAPVQVVVAGVVELPQADSLFQVVGAPAGSQLQAPPDNVLLVPAAQWHTLFDPLAAARPDATRLQVHARLTHDLPTDPSAAYDSVTGRARNLEVTLAGAAQVGDNLGATLGSARGDALYAQVLFLFLGLPGAVLAALLTATVASAGADRRRREHALLRARGATRTQLVRLGVIEAVLVGALGGLVGIGVAAATGQVIFGTAKFGATPRAAGVWGAAAVAAGMSIALLTVALPAWRDARATSVVGGRQIVGRARAPRWSRWGLDFVLLGTSAVVFWATGQNGYHLVLAPEGVPTISVSYWAFAGPALLWAGSALLAWRLADLVLHRGRPVMARLLRPFNGTLAGTVAASMSRQRRLLARAVVLVALTVSFAASTAVFNSTYRHQAEIDARLSNGSDVTVTESPGAAVGPGLAATLATVPGVRAVEPVQHRFAYVGADLQDLYGVRTDTIVGATSLQDAYFQGGSARSLMALLGSAPDSILLSAETVKDFQLQPADRITLRLQDGRTKQYRDVAFHYVGIAKEFPTAPRDSFLIANADYIATATGSDAVGAFLIDTGGHDSTAVAQRIQTVVGPGAKVTDIATSRRVVGSSLTAVDLSGLTRVELAFALVLAAASTGLVLALGLAERRRTFAIAGALGADSRQLGGFVWAEAVFVALAGLAAGAASGWLLSAMLVKVLTGVFDPPPAALAVPWTYLFSVAGLASAAVGVAAATAVRAARRAPISMLREL